MTEYNVEISERQRKAKELCLELLENGFVQANEEGATIFLSASARRAEYDVKERPKQKKLYKGKEFGFESAYALAVYFITECPLEWEKWKRQYAIWESIDETIVGEQAKDDARPTIDRIDDSKGYVRGNLQTLSDRENREKAYVRMRKQRAFFICDDEGKKLVVNESITATAKTMNTTSHETAKKYSFPYKHLEATATEAERKVQAKENGITYQTPQERMKSDKRMLASITAKQPQ